MSKDLESSTHEVLKVQTHYDYNNPRWDIPKQKELKLITGNGVNEDASVTEVDISDIPPGSPIISMKFFLESKIKHGVLCYKARLVARGFEEDSPMRSIVASAPTVTRATVRTQIAVAATYSWNVQSRDTKRAFLQSDAVE